MNGFSSKAWNWSWLASIKSAPTRISLAALACRIAVTSWEWWLQTKPGSRLPVNFVLAMSAAASLRTFVEDAGLETFASSFVRHAFYGIYQALEHEDLRTPLEWFARSMPDYWERRKRLIAVLDFIARIRTPDRSDEAVAALALADAVFGDSR